MALTRKRAIFIYFFFIKVPYFRFKGHKGGNIKSTY